MTAPRPEVPADARDICRALTFLGRLAEDSVAFVDDHQADVVVVDDVARVLEAVVRAEEVVDGYRLFLAELVTQDDVEDVGRSVVVVRQASLAQFAGGAVQLPEDALDCDEDQSQQLVQSGRHDAL